ncbi:hypothetical protein RRG08_066100 [Elysia crispata]|uniref:Uncharacterized protein n=1 Tax=Elysia crispata TaxID=231223 RepID=A0AAE0ZH21_9GAST|nr:hypothetical protein RRG08_066099 [Elysia crispata]KAK3769329.1 hypothetical protein RRG08_066100 [Elysia crispata]
MPERTVVHTSSHVPFKSRLTSRQENPVRDAGENSCSYLVSRPVQVSSHKSSRESSERCRREQLFIPRLTSRSSLVSQVVKRIQ